MTVFLMRKQESKKGKHKDDDDNLTRRDGEGNITHRGTIKVYTTVTDAKIKYSIDLDLLNSAREKSEELIDKLCKQLEESKTPAYKSAM